jgi:hypothetical protein
MTIPFSKNLMNATYKDDFLIALALKEFFLILEELYKQEN